MPVLVGTSGWQYRDWRGTVYPERLPARRWLAFLAGRFPTVEINSAFYRLPERSTFERWAGEVPDGFTFAVKASRYLTHVRRLREPAEPVSRLMERAEGLGDRLGPVLLQLPPNLRSDLAALDAALTAFPASVRVAVEFRHPSWDDDRTRALLESRGAACVLADRKGPLPPWWRTANWTYARFHEGRAQGGPCYGRTALSSAAERLRGCLASGDDAYVYFNNDAGGCAAGNAVTFAHFLGAPLGGADRVA